eukprot:SAG31_NODE_8630_length_1417_cov_1.307284_1_plen_267_part_00
MGQRRSSIRSSLRTDAGHPVGQRTPRADLRCLASSKPRSTASTAGQQRKIDDSTDGKRKAKSRVASWRDWPCCNGTPNILICKDQYGTWRFTQLASVRAIAISQGSLGSNPGAAEAASCGAASCAHSMHLSESVTTFFFIGHASCFACCQRASAAFNGKPSDGAKHTGGSDKETSERLPSQRLSGPGLQDYEPTSPRASNMPQLGRPGAPVICALLHALRCCAQARSHSYGASQLQQGGLTQQAGKEFAGVRELSKPAVQRGKTMH